jgi:hypothetical protein
MKKVIQLLEHQVDFVVDTITPFLALVGGYRSGKSYSLCHKAVYMASDIKNKGFPFIMMEPTMGMVRRVLEPTMIQVLQETGLKYTHLKQDSFILHFPTHDHTIWLLSAENYERAQGISASAVFCDEIDLLKKHVADAAWKTLVSRLTGGIQQACCCSTPEGFNWLYETFEEQARTNYRLIRARTRDNPFIPEEYFTRMQDEYTEQQLEAYLNGRFINLHNSTVYYQFDRNINCTNLTIDDFPNSPILIGQDFNVDNCASAIACVRDDKVYFIDEITGSKDTETTITIIKQRYPNRVIYVYPDSSGKNSSTRTSISDIALLKQAGFKLFYPTKNPPVVDRIKAVNRKLKNANGKVELYVNLNKCRELVKTFEQQAYVNGTPDKSTGLDHLADGMGYLIHYNWPIQGRSSIRQF